MSQEMKERWVRGAGRDHDRDHAFDPVVAGDRYGLDRALSLAIWERVRIDATDAAGRCDTEQAKQRFHELAARIAARGGRLLPEVGKRTRAGADSAGIAPEVWGTHELSPRTPGRETRVTAEARRWAQRVDARTTVHEDIETAAPHG